MTETVNTNWTLVAGHCGGIGRQVVECLLETDMRVVGYDRSRCSDDRLDLELISSGNSHEAIEANLAPLFSKLGPPKAVIVCIGTYRRIRFSDYDDASLQEILDDNFKAIFWISRAAVDVMEKAGEGRLILVASQAAFTGATDAVYAAGKAATVTLAKSLARDYGAKGLRVNVVAPGPVHTPMSAAAMSQERIQFYNDQIPIGRFSTPEEVASVLAFLATGACDSINGATIDVDGGLVRR